MTACLCTFVFAPAAPRSVLLHEADEFAHEQPHRHQAAYQHLGEPMVVGRWHHERHQQLDTERKAGLRRVLPSVPTVRSIALGRLGAGILDAGFAEVQEVRVCVI